MFLFASKDRFRKPAKHEQMPYRLNTEIASKNRATQKTLPCFSNSAALALTCSCSATLTPN
jgi:hypothetical protein